MELKLEASTTYTIQASSVSIGVTTITWKVVHEQTGAFQFGLWFSPASPVDTSGPPDQVVAYYQGLGDYLALRAQIASAYVVIICFAGPDQGPAEELLLPWSTLQPSSPSDQQVSFR